MGVELAPVEAMLDEIHQSLPSSLDKNSYTLGRMEVHNVVIAVMPEIGNNSAAAVATQLMNDFKSIRFGLLVGIGGGIPDERVNDIQLGDIVVSKPTDTYGGVVQFDRGKAHSNGRFERTGTLGKPPTMLRAAVEKLEAKHRREDSGIPKFLLEMLGKFPKMREEPTSIKARLMTSCSMLDILIMIIIAVPIMARILHAVIMATITVEGVTRVKLFELFPVQLPRFTTAQLGPLIWSSKTVLSGSS